MADICFFELVLSECMSTVLCCFLFRLKMGYSVYKSKGHFNLDSSLLLNDHRTLLQTFLGNPRSGEVQFTH